MHKRSTKSGSPWHYLASVQASGLSAAQDDCTWLEQTRHSGFSFLDQNDTGFNQIFLQHWRSAKMKCEGLDMQDYNLSKFLFNIFVWTEVARPLKDHCPRLQKQEKNL